MFPRILAAQRGQVLVLQDHRNSECKESVAIDSHSESAITISCYSYNPSTANFVRCAECDFNFAAKQILTCAVIEDIGTGTFLPCFLIEVSGLVNNATHKRSRKLDVTSYEYQVLLFIQEKGKVLKAGSFSTITPLSKCEVWLLNGPTICWVCDGSLNVVRAKSDKLTKVSSSTEEISNHLWNSEHSLKWCEVISGDIVAMATYPVLKEETSTSNLWFEDLIPQGWRILHCPNGDFQEGHITEMTKAPIIPNAYASIINSVCIDSRGVIVHCKDVMFSSDVSVIAATNQKQLLEFCRGRVQRVCDLPFGDSCEILPVARMEGSDLVMVKSEGGTVCAVERKTFKILQQWADISTILVDDFLFNGSEQILMIPEDPNKTHPLQGFILTDLDTCYVNDKDSGADAVIGDSKSVCNENLLSAIRALEARLQSGTASLREAETRCDERIKLIEQSEHALHKMVNEQDSQEKNMSTSDQGHLLCMYGSIQHQEVRTSAVSMVTEDKEVRVFKGWQRVVDTAWVVGVTIHNKTDSIMGAISLNLIPVSAGSNIHLEREPLTSECRVLFPSNPNLSSKTLTKQTKIIDPTEPKIKKQKLNCKSLEDRAVCLSPGEHADVVAIATVPDFAGYPVICCDMVLQWKQQDYGKQVTKSGDAERHWIERVRSCGRVWLSASDVVKGVLGIELAPLKPQTTEPLNQDTQALDATQMSTVLSVTSLHSNLNCIPEALKCTMGFIPSAKHDGLVCPSLGVLWGMRVMLEMKDSSHGVLTVWTKDKNQLMLFYHSLYQLLPDDITIHPLCSPLNQMEESITSSIQSMQQELTRVSGVHDAQSVSTSLDQDADDIMDVDDCKVTGDGSVVTEAAKKLMDVRIKFETDRLKLKDQGNDLTFDEERLRELEVDVSDYQQKTDAAVGELTRNMMYNLTN